MNEAVPGPVHVSRQGPVLLLTIDHPPVNAISRGVIAGIRRALPATVGGDCRVVVLTGGGPRFFSAGADLKEVAAEGEPLRAEGLDLTCAMESCPLPIIAAVNGIAFGGGCEVALAADVRIASTQARFGQPEVTLGIMPGWGGTQRLSRLIGRAAALPLLLAGEPFDAAVALQLGLVSQVVEGEDLLGAARRLAETFVAPAPLALAATKRAVHEGLDRPLADGLAVEARELAGLLTSEDAVEGVTAFLGKRAPRWSAR